MAIAFPITGESAIAIQDGYGIEPSNPIIRTEMEGGPAKQRRRFSQATTAYPIAWIFTQSEFADFETWHKDDIHDGADWFQLMLANGQGVTEQTARFVEPWIATPRGAYQYSVTSKVETRTRPLNT